MRGCLPSFFQLAGLAVVLALVSSYQLSALVYDSSQVYAALERHRRTPRNQSAANQAREEMATSNSQLSGMEKQVKESLATVKEAWRDSEEHFRIFHTHHLDTSSGGASPLLRINLPVSITTRKTKWTKLSDMALLTTFLPSLLRTIEPGYLYGVYLGYDQGDPLLDRPGVELEMQRLWNTSLVSLKMFRYNDTAHHNVWAVNYISKEAYLDGYDYFFRVNDDSEFLAPDWTSRLVEALQRNENFGAAGILDDANPRIWTHSIVSRIHLEIFGFHFPFSFGNYWSDDWITEAYTKRFGLWIYDISIKHHLHAERYNINWNNSKQRLSVELDRAQLRWKLDLCRVKNLCENETEKVTSEATTSSSSSGASRGYSRTVFLNMENQAKREYETRLKKFGGIKKVKFKN